MSGSFQPLTHGTLGLELAYGIVFAATLAGLIRARATLRQLLLSPIVAAPVTVLAALVIALFGPLLQALSFGPTSVLRIVSGMMLSAATGYVVGRLLGAHARGASGPLHRRGAVVSAAGPASTRGANQPASNGAGAISSTAVSITLAGIPIAPADETKHFKLIGTTGTGKSTAIQEMLTIALARGDRAIIADPDGGYLRRFYDASRDVILNPFDPDARKWDLFGEITNDYDVEQLARSLIPDSGGQDRIWSEYGRTLFSAVLQQAIKGNARSDTELFRLLNDAPVKELRLLLAGTSAAPFLEEGNEKFFGSVRSVVTSAVNVLKYAMRQQATPLSVRQWVRQGAARHAGGRGGVLFFPYKAGEIAALASTISAWMRLGIFEAMDQVEGDQRLWFVVDELDALGAIDGLKDALARLRKFGGRCVLGFQSIAQVSGTYGKGIAETIVENCGNTLILRCSASERGGTSEFASKLIGQREVLHTTRSKSRKPTDWMASTTSSEQLRIEPAVMASEIERLADLSGYLKVASVPDWFAVKLTPVGGAAERRPRRADGVGGPPSLDPTVPAGPASDPRGSESRAVAAATSEPCSPALSAVPAPLLDPQVGIPRRKARSGSPQRKAKRPRQQKGAGGPKIDPLAEPVDIERPASPQISASMDGLGAVQKPAGGAELRD
jgi:hypothetical protein